jgi:hypothetical protein
MSFSSPEFGMDTTTKRSERQTEMDTKKGKSDSASKLKWPINEIVWRTLVLRGNRTEDIAAKCGVAPELVDGWVASYRF